MYDFPSFFISICYFFDILFIFSGLAYLGRFVNRGGGSLDLCKLGVQMELPSLKQE